MSLILRPHISYQEIIPYLNESEDCDYIQYLKTHHQLPYKKQIDGIYDHTKLVGYYLPTYRRDHGQHWCMGFIYVGQNYRNYGIASEALSQFKQQYPDCIWRTSESNIISQHVAEKNDLSCYKITQSRKGKTYHYKQRV